MTTEPSSSFGRLAEAEVACDRAIALGCALGKELDDLGRYEEAFRYFAEGAVDRRFAAGGSAAGGARLMYQSTRARRVVYS